jgi:hypothetical protein
MEALHIPYNSHPRLAFLDISNMYPNIPTKTLTSLITSLCNWNSVNKKVEREVIKLTSIVLKQNYFQFNCNVYTQTNGLAMEPPPPPPICSHRDILAVPGTYRHLWHTPSAQNNRILYVGMWKIFSSYTRMILDTPTHMKSWTNLIKSTRRCNLH